MLQLTAIVPASTQLLNTARIQMAVSRELNEFSTALISTLAHYPPQEPTSYRRTGDLGRNWRPTWAGPYQVTISNKVNRKGRAYAVFVEGPPTGATGSRQTEVMAKKGWPSINTEAKRLWPGRTVRFQTAITLR